ncbi:hypothetical protein EV426DRAFT_612485 [Tirmania nivea]|nr:hypothetical protein EV426DRAFT_612485 [Tirmania nivea]
MSGASLCGPTNALSSLQKHATSDRTLQQDRLHAQAGPSIPQSIRSSHTSNLCHEFDSFSSGSSDFLHAPPAQLGGGIPSWAAEFQQLRVSQPTLQHNIPRGTWASPAPVAASSWHTEFLSTLSQPKTAYTPTPQQQFLHQQQQPQLHFLKQHQQQQQQQSTQFSSPALRTHLPSAYDSPNYLHDTQNIFYPHQHLHDPLADDYFSPPPESKAQQEASDAAFALAFDEAQRWQLESSQHDVLDSLSQSTPAPTTDNTAEEKGKRKDKVDDSDELSRTAGQLLESVATEQSQKFKESNFMKLMRQLRDKEVKVEGGEFVGVGSVS